MRLVTRLSTSSERRRWEPYEAIEWDSPQMRVTADDPRWNLPSWDPLGATTWYQHQTPSDRSHLGLWRVAALLQVGIEFEAILTQGLLSYAATLPNGHPAFRYSYHEIIEEAKHSMMFETFIRRCEVPASWRDTGPTTSYSKLAQLGSDMPALFFLCILAGEAVFDYLQRRSLAEPTFHPLLAAVHKLHCEDEARHLSFARATLRELVPALDRTQARRLRVGAPLALRSTADRMLEVPGALVDHWKIPDDVVAEAERGRSTQVLRRAGLEGVISLCRELDIVDDRTSERVLIPRASGQVDD